MNPAVFFPLKGLISFGLVNIPVALYPAVEDKQLHFNQLHKEDGGRIGYDKEYLALIRPVDQVLVLHTMHYPDEIRQPEGIGLPSAEVQLGKRELEMADLLVKSMSGEFQPAEYKDTHREELLEMLLAKAEGTEDQPIKAKLLPTNVTDLVARLKASIDQAEKQKKVKTARG